MEDMENQNIAPLLELGALMKAERQRLGYREEDVASHLKITTQRVRAIESGDMNSLPHAVYARGFIRAYAAFLGMDEEVIRDACSVLMQDTEEGQPIAPLTALEPVHTGWHIPWLAIILCLLFVLGAVWYFRDMLPLGTLSSVGKPATNLSVQPQPVPLPRVEPVKPAEVIPDNTTLVPAANSLATNGTVPVAADNGTLAVSAVAAPTEGGGAVAPNTAPAAETSPVSGTDEERLKQMPAIPAGGHQIVLLVSGDCWIRAVSDGREIEQRVLKKDETVPLPFKEKMMLRLGYPAGVKLFYDNKEIPLEVKSGRTLTLNFPADAPQN